MSEEIEQISEAPTAGLITPTVDTGNLAPIEDKEKEKNESSRNPQPHRNERRVELTRNFAQLTTSLAFAQLLGITQPDELTGSGIVATPPLQQDSISGMRHTQAPRHTHWIRFDPYTVTQRWLTTRNGANTARTVAAYRCYDRVTLSTPVLPAMKVSPNWMASVQVSLQQDPEAAKSTVVSATSASPGFAAYIVENVNGRLVLDEMIWFFRMLCLLQCLEDVVTNESYALMREFALANTGVLTNGPAYPTMLRVRVPANQLPDVPVYYANSNQFASFTRNQAQFVRRNISVTDLGTGVAVVPITSQDSGRFLIHLAASSLGSFLWNTWLGNFVLGNTVSPRAGGTVLDVVQFYESKGAKLVVPGPTRAIIFVVWDDAGPAAWTTPRTFGLGVQIPCLLAPVQGGGPDVNFATIFYPFYGIPAGDGQDPGGQAADIGSTWSEAYRYLQRNFSYGNAERRAIAAAAELFHDALLPFSPSTDTPPLPVQLHGAAVMPPVQPPVQGRAGSVYLRRAARQIQPAQGMYPAPGAAPAADHTWDIWDDTWGGRPCYSAPGVRGDNAANQTGFYAGLPQCLVAQGGYIVDPLNENYMGDWDNEPYWEQVLLRVSPNGYLRAMQMGTQALTPLNTFVGWHGIPPPDQRDVLVTCDTCVSGLPRMRIPPSNWLSRIACAMGAVTVEGSTLNWNDPAATNYYIRLVAHVLGSAYTSIIATSGLSVPCWLGITQPNQRFQTVEYPGQKYDAFRATTFGRAVPNQAQLAGSAAVSMLRHYTRYYRYDGLLRRSISLWQGWEEVAVVLNKFCSDHGKSLVPLNVHSLSWKNFMYSGNIHSGWATKEVVIEALDMCLATNSLRVTNQPPSITCTNMADTQVTNERLSLVLDIQCSNFIVENNPLYHTDPRTLMWCIPQVEIDNGNVPIYAAINNPVMLEGDGAVGLDVTWPDPVFWNWLAERAIAIGTKLVSGNWLGALLDTVQYAVRDIAKHITTGRWAWETPETTVSEEPVMNLDSRLRHRLHGDVGIVEDQVD